MSTVLEKINKINGQILSQEDIAKIDNNATKVENALNSLNTGTASGNIPVLNSNGKLDTGILPAIAITDTFPVETEAEMLALTAQAGDIAIRSDIHKSFILKTDGAGILGNWIELLSPPNSVTSVAGKTGVITLTSNDVGLGNVNNTSDLNKPISTATQTALDGKATVIALTATEYSAIPSPVATTLYLIKA